MNSAPNPAPPSLKTREEILNITLHSLGLFLSLIGFGLLLATAIPSGSLLKILSASIYGVSLFLLFIASILFHTVLALNLSWSKAFETVDHCAIYLLIAGTYTPFLLVSLNGTLRWIMLSLIWSLALLGIGYKVFFFYRSDFLSTLAYILMGWLALLIIQPLFQSIGTTGIALLAVGGVLYTLGAIFYLLDHTFAFAHAIWHGFVLAGSGCHFCTILLFVLS